MPTRMRIGVIGCGRALERSHYPALQQHPLWHLAGLCDPDPVRRSWAERTVGKSVVFDSLDQMLERTELEAVLIAVPPKLHVTLVQQALQRDLHVLLEKPGGASLEDAERIAQLADQSDRVLRIGFNRRFYPSYRAVRESAAARPTDIASGSFELEISIEDWGAISGYLGDDSRGGDVAYDLASHQIDLLVWMFGSPAVAVRCRQWERNGSAGERLDYDLRLENCVEMRCLAQHGREYHEHLTAHIDGTELVGYPTGLVRGRRGGWRSSVAWTAVRHRIERKLVRLGLRNDMLQISYRAQLDSFATAISGGQPTVAACNVTELVAIHRTLRALRVSRQSPGAWLRVAEA